MYHSLFEVTTDKEGKQTEHHGTSSWPIACYRGDLNQVKVVWHWHDEWELILASRGALNVGVGPVRDTLAEGEACFIRAGALHSVWKAETADSEYHSIVFHPRLIGSMDSIFWEKYVVPVQDPAFPEYLRISDDSAVLAGELDKAWTAEAEGKTYHEQEVRNILTRIAAHLSEMSEAKHPFLSEKEKRDMERTKVMLGYIEKHLSESITISDIAENAVISESECLRCFKRSIGTTPIQYLKELRIRRAAEMLSSYNCSVSYAAEHCGFFDMSYFSKSFRCLMGETPKQYSKRVHSP